MANTSNRGLGSSNMDEQKKRDIQSKGGKASSQKQDMSKLGQKGGQAQAQDEDVKSGELGRQGAESRWGQSEDDTF